MNNLRSPYRAVGLPHVTVASASYLKNSHCAHSHTCMLIDDLYFESRLSFLYLLHPGAECSTLVGSVSSTTIYRESVRGPGHIVHL